MDEMTKLNQTPHSVMMIKPYFFGFNQQTVESNVFQITDKHDSVEIAERAKAEFDKMVNTLQQYHIQLNVFEDTPTPAKPDAIFPNNWISFHEDGQVILYPMMAPNRRLERRDEIIETLGSHYNIREIIDLTSYQDEGTYLEGTGSIVFDHANRIAYACHSDRTDETLFRSLCNRLGYEPVMFQALDAKKNPIYHTNVMMSIGSKFAVICLDSIHNERDQEVILKRFLKTGHKVIAISYEQMYSFAGNILEVQMRENESAVLISERAFNSLLPGQIDAITKFAELIPLKVHTIEKYGGGSVRCMVAGIHLRRLELPNP